MTLFRKLVHKSNFTILRVKTLESLVFSEMSYSDVSDDVGKAFDVKRDVSVIHSFKVVDSSEGETY